MSRNRNKNRNRNNKITTPTSVQDSKIIKKSSADSFTNALARMGAGTNNIMNATQYPITRITRDFNLMNSLFRNSWIVKKIITTIPQDMCKNWFKISSEITPEMEDRYNTLEMKCKIQERIVEGLQWGRLYGGAAALILIDGHEDILDEPLIINDIMPNSFKGLMILDRWSGIYPSGELIEDINDPDFGLPKFYEIREKSNNSIVQKVHHSRILRFIGRKLPYFEDIAELNWGASEIEHVFDELVKRDNTSYNIASLIFQANLLINKVSGLEQLTALGDEEAQQDFYNVKRSQNEMRSNNAMMIIGEGDEITGLNYTFAGLSDVYNDFMLDISGACDIPVTRLFGRSPAGMNSTGESDEDMYYDMVGSKQKSELKPNLDKLLPIMFMSEFGYVPKDLNIQFNPIKTVSDKDMADLAKNKSDSIINAYTQGLINRKIGLSELHELSFSYGMFSNITDEDIENASTSFNDETDLGNNPLEGNKNNADELGGESGEGQGLGNESSTGVSL